MTASVKLDDAAATLVAETGGILELHSSNNGATIAVTARVPGQIGKVRVGEFDRKSFVGAVRALAALAEREEVTTWVK